MDAKQKRIFLGCFLCYCSAYVGRLNLAAALPQVSAALHLTAAQAGMLQTVFALVYAMGQLVNGTIADRVSARRYVMLGLCGSAAANLAFSLSDRYALLMAAWLVNAVAQSMLWTPIVRLIAEWFRGEARERVTFKMSFTIAIGHFIAWAVSGAMARAFNWQWSFLLPSIVLLCAAFAGARLLEDAPRTQREEGQCASEEKKKGTLSAVLFRSGLWMMLICCAFNGFVRDGVMNWAPSILDALGATSWTATAIPLVIPVANLIGILTGRLLYRRAKGHTRTTIACLMLLGAAAAVPLLFFGMKSIALCALLMAALCALMYGVNPLLTTLLPMEFEDLGCVGLVAGLVDCSIYIGSAPSGGLVGAIRDGFGWETVFALWLAASLAAFALCALSQRARKRT